MIHFEPIMSSSAGCCYMLTSSFKHPILLDCGIPTNKQTEQLLGSVIKISELEACLISHSHLDHSMQGCFLSKFGVPLVASEETLDSIRSRCKSLAEQPVEPLKNYQYGQWKIMPFECVHDCPGTYGFAIEGFGARCLYLTDSAYCKYKFDRLTHIFIECNHSAELVKANTRSGEIGTDRYKRTTQNHMSLERLITMLKANDLSQCKEIHLLHLSDSNSDEKAFKKAVEAATGVPAYVAKA